MLLRLFSESYPPTPFGSIFPMLQHFSASDLILSSVIHYKLFFFFLCKVRDRDLIISACGFLSTIIFGGFFSMYIFLILVINLMVVGVGYIFGSVF